jgi:molybdopterin molybdotransferase
MTQLSNDCFKHSKKRISLENAVFILEKRIKCIKETQKIKLDQALGRILSKDIISKINVPPFNNSAVDGYAFKYSDLNKKNETTLKLTGRITAGQNFNKKIKTGEIARIFTGAKVPEGADTVIMQEDCNDTDNQIVLKPGIFKEANIRKKGEDIKYGKKILLKGSKLKAQDIGLIASIGIKEIHVFEKLTVGIFTTGNELYEPGAKTSNSGIYDSNRYCLKNLLKTINCSVKDYGIKKDNEKLIKNTLKKISKECDLIITTGGMSVGEEDYVRKVIEKNGSLNFWNIAIKPGRPVALGNIFKKSFIGLPGNPVSVMITFLKIALPTINKLSGFSSPKEKNFIVTTDFNFKKKSGRKEFLRVTISKNLNGQIKIKNYPKSGSGVFTSMVETDGLIELPEKLTYLKKGTKIRFVPYSEILI